MNITNNNNNNNNNNHYLNQTFNSLKLIEKRIESANFENCIFKNNKFNSTRFIDCSFIECKFIESDLSLVSFTSSKIQDISFKNCKVVGVDWTVLKRDVLPLSISFLKSKIDLSSFFGMEIFEFKLIDCSAKEVDFREASLIDSDFANSDLEKSLFNNTKLNKSSFIGSSNYDINFKNNSIKKCKFSILEVLNLLSSLEIEIK